MLIFCFKIHKMCSNNLEWNWLEEKCKRREGTKEGEKEKEGGRKGGGRMNEYNKK